MRTGVPLASDRELRTRLGHPAIHNRAGPHNTAPHFEKGAGKRRKGEEREGEERQGNNCRCEEKGQERN